MSRVSFYFPGIYLSSGVDHLTFILGTPVTDSLHECRFDGRAV